MYLYQRWYISTRKDLFHIMKALHPYDTAFQIFDFHIAIICPQLIKVFVPLQFPYCWKQFRPSSSQIFIHLCLFGPHERFSELCGWRWHYTWWPWNETWRLSVVVPLAWLSEVLVGDGWPQCHCAPMEDPVQGFHRQAPARPPWYPRFPFQVSPRFANHSFSRIVPGRHGPLLIISFHPWILRLLHPAQPSWPSGYTSQYAVLTGCQEGPY